MIKVLKWIGIVVGGLLVLLVILVIVVAIFDPDGSGSETVAKAAPEPACTGQVEPADYDYLARYPEQAQGNCYQFKGEIIQRLPSSDGEHTFRISITQGSYGIWTDPVLVVGTDQCLTAGNAGKALEEDIVSFRGQSHGDTTYETIFGGTVEIPLVFCE